jgi:hypothetical protein
VYQRQKKVQEGKDVVRGEKHSQKGEATEVRRTEAAYTTEERRTIASKGGSCG